MPASRPAARPSPRTYFALDRHGDGRDMVPRELGRVAARPAPRQWVQILMMGKLILASASPRRAELLQSAGYSFAVQPIDIDETPLASEAASDYVIRVARDKARAIAPGLRGSDAVVLAADTAVVTDSRIMGKPRNDEDAANMLATLSGSIHQVLTGVVVHTDRRELVELVATRVHFLPLTSAEIAWYVATGEPSGKAGGYAIQGHAARFIDWIDGSWSNVVGLPLATVSRMLKEVGQVD